ncbi:MAG: hypothetical protein QMC67_10225 [Candidatus Wallbacteria bacterium]
MSLRNDEKNIFEKISGCESNNLLHEMGWVMADLTKNIMNEYIVPVIEGKLSSAYGPEKKIFPRAGDIVIVMNNGSKISDEETETEEENIDFESAGAKDDMSIDMAEFGVFDDNGGIIHIGREEKCNVIVRSELSDFLNGSEKYYIFMADEFDEKNFKASKSKCSKVMEEFEFQDNIGCLLRAKSLMGAQISFKNIYYDSLAFTLWCKFNINSPDAVKSAMSAIADHIVTVENEQ